MILQWSPIFLCNINRPQEGSMQLILYKSNVKGMIQVLLEMGIVIDIFIS